MSNYLQLEYCKTSQFSVPASDYSTNGSAYALIFDPVTGKAIQFAGVGVTSPPSLAIFDQANQQNFSYLLNNDRLYCWSAHISGPLLNLPDNDYGENYLIEYWVTNASGATPTRSLDYFVDIEKFVWVNGRRVLSRLDIAEDEAIASLVSAARTPIPQCFCNISYDNEIQRLGFTAWMEKDNVVQADCTQATVTIWDSSGTVFVNKPLNTKLVNGQFVDQVLNSVPNPDETYFGEIKITDGSGNQVITGFGVSTWD